jgi:hypothetical protein
LKAKVLQILTSNLIVSRTIHKLYF